MREQEARKCERDNVYTVSAERERERAQEERERERESARVREQDQLCFAVKKRLKTSVAVKVDCC